MKKIISFFLAASILSCNNQATDTKKAMKDSTATATVSASPIAYAYNIDHPDYWEIGSTANTIIALNSLKAWELGKMDESLKYFSDSVLMQFDGLNKKMSNDSVKAMLSSGWNGYKTISIKMHDWESVMSKDKKEEWVTIWYTQQWETKNAVKDSSTVVNDFQIKDGKIIRLVEYTRKLH
jgi:hypothetical protein